MHPITIIKRGADVPPGTAVYYCGRGSPLGNPHVMEGKSLAERDRVCDLFERGFPNDAQREMCDRIAAAAKAGPVALECFCAPKRCHTETVKLYIEENYP